MKAQRKNAPLNSERLLGAKVKELTYGSLI